MIPLPDRSKSKRDKDESHINKLRAHRLPIDNSQGDANLAALVAAWPDLPEALRAGIMAMVKAASGKE